MLSFSIEARGYGAVLAAAGESAPAGVQKLMMRMARLTATPLGRFSSKWTMLPQKIVEIAPTKRFSPTTQGMVLIPAGKYRFKVSGVEIEGDDAHGVDVQYPWEDRPRRSHDKELEIKAFLIDKQAARCGTSLRTCASMNTASTC